MKKKIQKSVIKKPALDLQLAMVIEKFTKLKNIQNQISKIRPLYAKHDEIMNELLPLFITVNVDEFKIRREIIIGNHKYKLNPYFYDPKKGSVQANIWKSTAFKTATIE